jgi:hypothetical protein
LLTFPPCFFIELAGKIIQHTLLATWQVAYKKSLPNHSSRSERFGLESASVCRIFFENIFKKYFQTPEKYIFKKYFGLGNLFSTFFEESFREKIF